MAATDFLTGLGETSEIDITVTGRKSGRAITLPVWFTIEGDTLYLLPGKGSKTEWYKNLLKTPSIGLSGKGQTLTASAIILTDAAPVGKVIQTFRDKYSAGQINSLYSGFDVAIEVPLG